MIDNTRGILAMSASVVVFIFNDALIKLAAETDAAGAGDRPARRLRHPVVRAGAAGERRAGGRSRIAANPLVLLRGVLEAAAAIIYLVALSHIPFAIATAINLSTPLFLAVLAVLMLSEDVALAALERDRRGLRGRAAGDPAAARRHQRLDLVVV